MYRFKQLFGCAMSSRNFDAQAGEIHAWIAAMNNMAHLGILFPYGQGELRLK
ncbi:hypothetical protein CCP3SC15_1170004 [Gammaproteobacteria bacterium]